jgi:hypothetical protein
LAPDTDAAGGGLTGRYNTLVPTNVYFELTRAFNVDGPVAALASGQAVVFYRVAIMSKDGDWVIRETDAACARVLEVLAGHGASYRPGAPLDVRWLAGGWSSHFEFFDEAGRRARCDFFSRPPRVHLGALRRLFRDASDPLVVVDLETLILMKQSQRAKDYPVIGELAAKLPPPKELEFTTDPDRLLALAPTHGRDSTRPAVRAARAGDRDAVVVALARERDSQQRADRARVEAYTSSAAEYLTAFARLPSGDRELPAAHETVVALAERLLPPALADAGDPDASAQ